MFLIGKTLLLCMQCRGIGPHVVARGKSHWFSRVALARGVYSRVTTRMPILNGSLFSEVRTLVSVGRTPREAKLDLVGQYGCY